MNRVTLAFKSQNGGEYLYDDVTGNIFPWDPVQDAVLNRELGKEPTKAEDSLLRSAPVAELAAKTAFIRRWREQYHAFARNAEEKLPVPTPEEARRIIWDSSQVLVLSITEHCNLACKYCCYASGAYQYNRKPSRRKMSRREAIRIVDWFVSNKAPQLARDPRRQFGLSFYGGEPLTHIRLIDGLMKYVNRRYPGLFIAILTTNGVLLTPQNVKILVDREVTACVSIDGPEDEHDRLRVDLEGKGTWRRIVRNLAYIKRAHPRYWGKMMCMSVYDPKSDLVGISRFFHEQQDVMPRSGFVNEVGSHNTGYFEQFTKEDFELFAQRLSLLRNEYAQAKVRGQVVSGYNEALSGAPIISLALRGRADDRKPFVPYTGACFPGYRMAVAPGGKIDMCERVNGTNPIGDMDRGLDYERIIGLVREYQDKVLHRCAGCPVTRLCPLCFAFAETKGGVAEPPGWCQNTLARARQTLADYISMLEANDRLRCVFEQDSLRLQADRALFQA